jgi:hypothetical protein
MPQAGTPKDILKPDLLGIDHGVNALFDLPWGADREVVTGMLRPMIKFARDLSNLITAQEFQEKSMVKQFDAEMRKVATQLQNLYAKRKGSEFSELLSCVKVRMAYEDGAATPSGLLLDELPDVVEQGGEDAEAEDDHGRGKGGKGGKGGKKRLLAEEELDPEYEPGAKGKKAKALAKSGSLRSGLRSGSEHGSPSKLAVGSKRARPSPASSSKSGKSKCSVAMEDVENGLLGFDEDEVEELLHPDGTGSGSEEEEDDDDGDDSEEEDRD